MAKKEKVQKTFGNLDAIMGELKKDYEITPTNFDEYDDCPRWRTSSPRLNKILGGGLPKGRIMEIYGTPSGGKTALSTIMAGDVLRQGGKVAWIDMECAFDPKFAEKLGLDAKNENFIPISQTVKKDGSLSITGETVFTLIEKLTSSGEIDLIVVDSVANMTPKAELEGEMGDSFMGLQARMMNSGLRKTTGFVSSYSTAVIFINQIRMKLGVMFGNPETTPGGNGLPFYSSIRLEVRRGEILGKETEAYGIVSKIKCVKNKTAPPFRSGEVELDFARGLNSAKEYVKFGKELKLIEGSTMLSYGGLKGNGVEKFTQVLKQEENKEVLESLIEAVEKINAGDYEPGDPEEVFGDDETPVEE